MNRNMYRNVTRIAALSTLTLASLTVGTNAANAGIFHHKNKPLKTSDDALASVKSQQPDKELFDRAMLAMKHGKYDIARLDLQDLLNTYPDSEYQMRAKLAIGDTWFREGGSAAMEQAESEYKDFITFFPNQPEAAEAQMKVADIYFKQMGKPDRDPTKITRAEEEYRQMILQFPDSTLVPQAKARLREVQEVMASHEFDIGSYYLSQEDFPAAIARLQSLVDAYPQFSQADQALIGIGNAYTQEAQFLNRSNLNAAAKERVVALYDQRAAQAYDRVILEYPMMPHADDARDHLEALNLPVPSPSSQQLAASEQIEQSRSVISLKDRAAMLITARPATAQAARIGEPSLTDPKPILPSTVSKETTADVNWAQHPDGKPAPSVTISSNAVTASSTPLTAASAAAPASTDSGNDAPAGAGESLQLQDVTSGGANAPDTSTTQTVSAPTEGTAPSHRSGPAGNNIQASGAAGTDDESAPTNEAAPATGGQSNAWPSAAPQANGGLQTVAPKENTPLPATQAPAEAPDQVNDVHASGHAVNTTDQNPTASGKKRKKNPKPKFNSGEESSSRHKKKKGVKKLNPF